MTDHPVYSEMWIADHRRMTTVNHELHGWPIPAWAARSLLFGRYRTEPLVVQGMRDRGTTGQLEAVTVTPHAVAHPLSALKPLRELTPAEIYDRFGPPALDA